MNKIGFIIPVIVFLLYTTRTFSQEKSLKIGHLNVVEIVSALPESDSAQLLLENDAKELEEMLENMQVELNNLENDFASNREAFSDLIRKTKESEILDMRGKIYNFQQNAQQQLQQRNFELLQPIYEKVQNAIDKIATRDSFTYILDVSKGLVVFTSSNSQDISTLVLQELGVEN